MSSERRINGMAHGPAITITPVRREMLLSATS
jgi:hypothetical protein